MVYFYLIEGGPKDNIGRTSIIEKLILLLAILILITNIS